VISETSLDNSFRASHHGDLEEAPESKSGRSGGPGTSKRALRDVVSNLRWLTLSTGLTIVSTAVANAMLARKMGAASFGEWAIVAATTSWIFVIRGGIGSHLTRLSSTAEDVAQNLLAPSWMLMVIWGIALGAFGLIVNVALQSQRLLTASLLAFAGTFVGALSYLIVAVFAGRNQMQWSLADSAQAWLLALCVVLIPAKYLSCTMVASIFLVTSAMPAIPCLAMGVRRLKPAITRSLFEAAWGVAPDNVWLIGIQLLVTFHLSIDICLLRLFRDSAQVGLFAAALKVIIAVRLLPWLVMTSLIPELSRSSLQDNQFASRVWSTMMNTLLPIEGVFVLIFAFMPGRVLGALYSHSFRGSSPALIILGISLIPHCLWQVLSASMMSAGQYKKHFLASLFCLVVHAAASATLIVRYGATGASWAFGIAECAALFSIAVAAWRGLGSFSFSVLWRYVACLGFPAAIGAISVMRGWSPVMVCTIVLIGYVIALLKAGVVSPARVGTLLLHTGLRRG